MAVRIPIGRTEELEISVMKQPTKMYTQYQTKTVVYLNVITADRFRGRRWTDKRLKLDGDIVPFVFEQILKLLEKSNSK